MDGAFADWLPGVLSIERGTRADFLALERFHYIGKPPATYADIWRASYRDDARALSHSPGTPGEGSIFPPLPPGEGSIFPPLPPGEGSIFPPLPPGEGSIFPPLPPGEGSIFPPLPPGEGRGEGSTGARIVAVGVLSYPVPSCRTRERALHLTEQRYDAQKIRWLNHNLRTISRIIVHPQFRGIGLARDLVRIVCQASGTRYVEAMAIMGRAIPFFDRAGMRRYEPADETSPIYYLWDRDNQHNQKPMGGTDGIDRGESRDHAQPVDRHPPE